MVISNFFSTEHQNGRFKQASTAIYPTHLSSGLAKRQMMFGQSHFHPRCRTNLSSYWLDLAQPRRRPRLLPWTCLILKLGLHHQHRSGWNCSSSSWDASCFASFFSSSCCQAINCCSIRTVVAHAFAELKATESSNFQYPTQLLSWLRFLTGQQQMEGVSIEGPPKLITTVAKVRSLMEFRHPPPRSIGSALFLN